MGFRKSIDELARRGAKVEAERRQRIARAQAAKLAEQRTMAAISTSMLGGLRSYTAGLVIISLVAAPTFYALTLHADSSKMAAEEYCARIAAPFLVPVVVVLIVRQLALWAGHMTYQSTLNWFAALPFPVNGADKLLSEAPDKTFENRIVTAGSRSRIAAAVAGLGNRRITARAESDCVIVTIDVASKLDNYPTAPATNYRGLQLVRTLVDEVLRAVHGESPIQSLELKSSS